MTPHRLIYFDNSATTGVKPQEVINAVANTMRFLSANPGRSAHPLAMSAAELVYNTRKIAAKFFGQNMPDRVIFTYNCTDSLNAAILGAPGGHVITTAMEHNSVLRPLHHLEKLGKTSLTILEPDRTGTVTADMVAGAVRSDTVMAAITHVSNVTGAVNPIGEIGAMLKGKKIIFLVDAAQSAGYFDIDMERDGIDCLCTAGHKGLHGPQGIGLMLLSGRYSPSPVRFGGTGTSSDSLDQPADLPESLESGTIATHNVAGLNAALTWCADNRFKMRNTVKVLSESLYEGLVRIRNVTVYSPPKTASGVISFNIGGLDSVETAQILAEEYAVCVRAGLHCAPMMHKHLGTLSGGAVRVSLSGENTYHEVLHLLQAIREISYN